jgi:hypothetical protein
MKFSGTSFVAGAVVALIVGSGTAYAATGHGLILGKSNTASSTTTLSNARGTALALNSKAGTAPLRVNRNTKVSNLNADLLDGRDSTSFALTAGQTNTISRAGVLADVDEDGTPDGVIAVATCPAGTHLTGGGGDDVSDDGTLFINSPLDRTSWVVASTTSTLTDVNARSITAYAVCYNPRGGVAGGSFRTTTPAATLAHAKALAARKLG